MPIRPNLLFLMPDQLRPDFLSCYGADFIQTPHIDSLAARGVRFEKAYSTFPICVPARAALLTGLNAIRTGVTDNGQWLRPDLAACGIHTWPELLNGQGYYTGAIGKMHFYPWDIVHGFQYRVASEDKRWIRVRDDYQEFLHSRGLRKLHGNEQAGYYGGKGAMISPIPWEASVDHFVGQEAVRFIDEYADEGPFALMVGFPGPHCPYDPTPDYLEGIDPAAMPPAIPATHTPPEMIRGNVRGNLGDWNGVDYTEFTDAHKQKIRAHYTALVKQIDNEIGDILAALERTGQLENTLIIFASDHGDYLGDHGMIGKSSFYEASIHVPLILCGPEVSGPAASQEIVALLDVTASLLHAGGAPLPGYLDSRPLPGLGAERTPHDYLFGATSGGWMIYDGRWKLCKYATGDILFFDLASDPTEERNLAGDPVHLPRYLALDAALTQELLRSVTAANFDQRVYTGNSLWADDNFGKRGWQRVYPQRIG
ncbi:MAG: sulfatase-like hydrolase/transferase [Chloroflexi bacterium]|nr:sulfatase-like hydrolase/transferase [Chloroflexota bacterium]